MSVKNFRAAYKKYRDCATKAGKKFNLSIDEAWEIATLPCTICQQDSTICYDYDGLSQFANKLRLLYSDADWTYTNVFPVCVNCISKYKMQGNYMMSYQQKQLYELVHPNFGDMSIAEAAKKVGITEGTARVILWRLRQRFPDAFKAYDRNKNRRIEYDSDLHDGYIKEKF